MSDNEFAVILMPTLKCNADCEYCFEHKTSDVLSPEIFTVFVEKFGHYVADAGISKLTIYWQGGEVLTLSPDWLLRARDRMEEMALSRGCKVKHQLQTNLIGYSKRWNKVLTEMFDNCAGSSLDFPNVHRKVVGRTPETFNQTWVKRFGSALECGINVGVISVPNAESFRIGPKNSTGTTLMKSA